jgi:endogenous inhibitor of DNA gyrase (YacG/DUF329 family)
MSTPNTSRRGKGCPICGKPPSAGHAPFCGRGCKDRDLLNWLGDGYRAPGPPAADSEGGGLDSDG